jgi:hypothetical protein
MHTSSFETFKNLKIKIDKPSPGFQTLLKIIRYESFHLRNCTRWPKNPTDLISSDLGCTLYKNCQPVAGNKSTVKKSDKLHELRF